MQNLKAATHASFSSNQKMSPSMLPSKKEYNGMETASSFFSSNRMEEVLNDIHNETTDEFVISSDSPEEQNAVASLPTIKSPLTTIMPGASDDDDAAQFYDELKNRLTTIRELPPHVNADIDPSSIDLNRVPSHYGQVARLHLKIKRLPNMSNTVLTYAVYYQLKPETIADFLATGLGITDPKLKAIFSMNSKIQPAFKQAFSTQWRHMPLLFNQIIKDGRPFSFDKVARFGVSTAIPILTNMTMLSPHFALYAASAGGIGIFASIAMERTGVGKGTVSNTIGGASTVLLATAVGGTASSLLMSNLAQGTLSYQIANSTLNQLITQGVNSSLETVTNGYITAPPLAGQQTLVSMFTDMYKDDWRYIRFKHTAKNMLKDVHKNTLKIAKKNSVAYAIYMTSAAIAFAAISILIVPCVENLWYASLNAFSENVVQGIAETELTFGYAKVAFTMMSGDVSKLDFFFRDNPLKVHEMLNVINKGICKNLPPHFNPNLMPEFPDLVQKVWLDQIFHPALTLLMREHVKINDFIQKHANTIIMKGCKKYPFFKKAMESPPFANAICKEFLLRCRLDCIVNLTLHTAMNAVLSTSVMQLTDSHNISALGKYAHTKLNTEVIPWIGQSGIYENIDETLFKMTYSVKTELSKETHFPTMQHAIQQIRMATGINDSQSMVAEAYAAFQTKADQMNSMEADMNINGYVSTIKNQFVDKKNDPLEQLSQLNDAMDFLNTKLDNKNRDIAQEARKQKEIHRWMDNSAEFTTNANKRHHHQSYKGSWLMRYKHGDPKPMKADLRSKLSSDAAATFNTGADGIDARLLRKQYYELPKRFELLKQWQAMAKDSHPGLHKYASEEEKEVHKTMEHLMDSVLYPYGTDDLAPDFKLKGLAETDANRLAKLETPEVFNAEIIRRLQGLMRSNDTSALYAEMENYIVLQKKYTSCIKLHSDYYKQQEQQENKSHDRPLTKNLNETQYRNLMDLPLDTIEYLATFDNPDVQKLVAQSNDPLLQNMSLQTRISMLSGLLNTPPVPPPTDDDLRNAQRIESIKVNDFHHQTQRLAEMTNLITNKDAEKKQIKQELENNIADQQQKQQQKQKQRQIKEQAEQEHPPGTEAEAERRRELRKLVHDHVDAELAKLQTSIDAQKKELTQIEADISKYKSELSKINKKMTALHLMLTTLEASPSQSEIAAVDAKRAAMAAAEKAEDAEKMVVETTNAAAKAAKYAENAKAAADAAEEKVNVTDKAKADEVTAADKAKADADKAKVAADKAKAAAVTVAAKTKKDAADAAAVEKAATDKVKAATDKVKAAADKVKAAADKVTAEEKSAMAIFVDHMNKLRTQQSHKTMQDLQTKFDQAHKSLLQQQRQMKMRTLQMNKHHFETLNQQRIAAEQTLQQQQQQQQHQHQHQKYTKRTTTPPEKDKKQKSEDAFDTLKQYVRFSNRNGDQINIAGKLHVYRSRLSGDELGAEAIDKGSSTTTVSMNSGKSDMHTILETERHKYKTQGEYVDRLTKKLADNLPPHLQNINFDDLNTNEANKYEAKLRDALVDKVHTDEAKLRAVIKANDGTPEQNEALLVSLRAEAEAAEKKARDAANAEKTEETIQKEAEDKKAKEIKNKGEAFAAQLLEGVITKALSHILTFCLEGIGRCIGKLTLTLKNPYAFITGGTVASDEAVQEWLHGDSKNHQTLMSRLGLSDRFLSMLNSSLSIFNFEVMSPKMKEVVSDTIAHEVNNSPLLQSCVDILGPMFGAVEKIQKTQQILSHVRQGAETLNTLGNKDYLGAVTAAGKAYISNYMTDTFKDKKYEGTGSTWINRAITLAGPAMLTIKGTFAVNAKIIGAALTLSHLVVSVYIQSKYLNGVSYKLEEMEQKAKLNAKIQIYSADNDAIAAVQTLESFEKIAKKALAAETSKDDAAVKNAVNELRDDFGMVMEDRNLKKAIEDTRSLHLQQVNEFARAYTLSIDSAKINDGKVTFSNVGTHDGDLTIQQVIFGRQFAAIDKELEERNIALENTIWADTLGRAERTISTLQQTSDTLLQSIKNDISDSSSYKFDVDDQEIFKKQITANQTPNNNTISVVDMIRNQDNPLEDKIATIEEKLNNTIDKIKTSKQNNDKTLTQSEKDSIEEIHTKLSNYRKMDAKIKLFENKKLDLEDTQHYLKKLQNAAHSATRSEDALVAFDIFKTKVEGRRNIATHEYYTDKAKGDYITKRRNLKMSDTRTTFLNTMNEKINRLNADIATLNLNPEQNYEQIQKAKEDIQKIESETVTKTKTLFVNMYITENILGEHLNEFVDWASGDDVLKMELSPFQKKVDDRTFYKPEEGTNINLDDVVDLTTLAHITQIMKSSTSIAGHMSATERDDTFRKGAHVDAMREFHETNRPTTTNSWAWMGNNNKMKSREDEIHKASTEQFLKAIPDREMRTLMEEQLKVAQDANRYGTKAQTATDESREMEGRATALEKGMAFVNLVGDPVHGVTHLISSLWDVGYSYHTKSDRKVKQFYELKYTTGDKWRKFHDNIFAQTLNRGILADRTNREQFQAFMTDVTTVLQKNKANNILDSAACKAANTCPPPEGTSTDYWNNIVSQQKEALRRASSSSTSTDPTKDNIDKTTQAANDAYYLSVFETVCGTSNNTMLHCSSA